MQTATQVGRATRDLPEGTRPTVDLTIIVPAYNEAACIGDTLRSLQVQTVVPARIVVVDDCSTDDTGDICARLGVEVLRPEANTGSKAGAQNLALARTDTEFVMAVDADTVLADDAVELVLDALHADERTAAACGYVVPQRVRTVWERGRYVENLYSFAFAKRVQEFYARPLISSGCFSAYRTAILKSAGGWNTRTVAEDMDLTWSFYESGYGVRFVPEACSYPVEPRSFALMRTQLRRWSHGFWQNVALHWRPLSASPMLMSTVAVAMWDAVVASLVFLLLVPALVVFVSPAFLLAYVIDLPVLVVAILVDAVRRREVGAALVSLPAFAVLRLLNVVLMMQAFVKEIVLRRRLTTFEKGH
jgi:biofilm PGA synthesis N-glycosyltransferase PgaC